MEEAIRQVVIGKEWPAQWKAYMQRFIANPIEDWRERCKCVGILSAELGKIATSKQAENWFAANVRHVRDKGITLSPTLTINGHVVTPFPQTPDQLRVVLCSFGVMENNCRGVRCSRTSRCPPKQSFVVNCRHGICNYTPEPLRPDAVEAYLIIPEDCVPCEAFPVDDALKGWCSYLKVERIGLQTDKAQALLHHSRIKAFPVMVVSGDLSKRAWGARCIKELNLVSHNQVFLVSMEWSGVPFLTYAQIQADQNALRVKPSHYAGALLLHQIGQLEFAAKSYRLALANNTNDYRSWNNLGAILYDNQTLKQTGGAMFQRAVKLNALYEPALKNLARYYTDQGDNKEMLSTTMRLGWLDVQSHRWEEASLLFRKCLTDKVSEFSALKGLAYISAQQGRYNAALENLQKCLQINPQPDSDFANLLAGVYFRIGDRGKALDWYVRAINNPSPSPQAYPNLCFLLDSTAKWDKLLNVATEAWERYPNDAAFAFYKAKSLSQLESTEFWPL